MNKRTATIKALILLTLLLVGQTLYAQTTVTQEGVVYTLNGDHYEVTGFDLASAEAADWKEYVLIADDIENVPVTKIADNAFDATVNTDCAKIKTMELGSNITAIGDYAFYLCKGLTEVMFFNQLETIGLKAFYSCTALTSVSLPGSMTRVGNSAFYGCRMLTSLTVEANGLQIETSAFSSCPSLYNLTFLGTPPILGSTAFYGVGRLGSPAYVYVPKERLADYVTLMKGTGTDYSWKIGEGYMSLRTRLDGLVYSYVAADGDTPACLQIVAVDQASLVDKGTENVPAYLLTSVSDLHGFKVTGITRNAFSTSEADKVFAIDLRQATLSGLNVDRTTGQFAGVARQTMIYLPKGNTSTESNVIIGGAVATIIQVGRPARNLTAEEVTNGRATWLLNNHYGLHIFGQAIGTDATPQPAISGEQQEVWQAAFTHLESKQYRYANTNGTVALPNAVSLGFDEGQIVTFYTDGEIDKPFTATTKVTTDTEVSAYPQTTTLSLNNDALTFHMSGTTEERRALLIATALPEGCRQEVTWSSDAPAIVSVDNKGNIVALSAGKAVITATSRDNSAVTATCRITVIPRPTSIELCETEFTIALSAIEEPVHQLSATIYPLEAIQDVTWTSQNEEICTVDENGLVTGLTPGKTVVKCSPKDNSSLSALCYVTVLPAANSVWISRNTYTMLPDDMEQLKARVLPSTAIQSIVWTSSDESVATVSDEGVVVAKAQGETTITATSAAMPSLSNKCVITVVGIGTQTTIKDITYEITALDADNLHMTITHIADNLLQKGGEMTIPDSAYYARLHFAVKKVADDAIGNSTNNTLVYVPKGITYKGEASNVVVATDEGNKCIQLNITDGADFVTSHTFTAERIDYMRQCPESDDEPFPVSLPYSMKSSAESLRFFDLQKQDDDMLIYYEVEETEPYKPYLALAARESLQLGGENIEVGPYRRNTDVYVGTVQFIATMKRLDDAYLTAANGCLFEDGDWHLAETGSEVPVFSAWLYTTVSPLYTELVTLEQQHATALQSVRGGLSATSPARIYDLRGRFVGSDITALPHGVYLVNGKKIVK